MEEKNSPTENLTTKDTVLKSGLSSLEKAFILIILLVVTATGIGVYFYINQKQNGELKDLSTSENEKIVRDIRKMILLPEGEPVVATIQNAKNLKTQNPDAYENAIDGDKVLIFSDIAVVYRPDSKLIIKVVDITNPSDMTLDASSEQVSTE